MNRVECQYGFVREFVVIRVDFCHKNQKSNHDGIIQETLSR